MRRCGIADASNNHSIHYDALIVDDVKACAPQNCAELLRVAELLMVAGDEVDAERRSKLEKWGRNLVRIHSRSIEEIAGHEDDVRTQLPRHCRDAPRETRSVNVAQMQIAHHESGAASPCRR